MYKRLSQMSRLSRISALVITAAVLATATACTSNSSSSESHQSSELSSQFSSSETSAENSAALTGAMTDSQITEMVKNAVPESETLRRLSAGSLKTDGTDIGEADELGNIYQKVIESEYTSVADVKAAMEKLYTTAYVEKEFKYAISGEFPMYKDIDGALCKNVSLGGAGEYEYACDEVKVTENTEKKFSVTMPYQDFYDNKGTATFVFVDENGWKISAIDRLVNS